MSHNRKILIDVLAANGLSGRYANIVPVNCDQATGDKLGAKGCFSVVFRATDSHEGDQNVAIKFFDPDVTGLRVPYRLDAFSRECQLLASLAQKHRCLQLVQPLSDLTIDVPTAAGAMVRLNCSYFVTEWLDGDIQDFFDAQDQFEALAKLAVFRDAVLAAFALHLNDIHHRDLKPDNLMRSVPRSNVIAIDLGTAARLSSAGIGDPSDYSQPVGATAFAPPEAFFGLAGVRKLGPYADIFALGCMLYGLFNDELYLRKLLYTPSFMRWRGACEAHMLTQNRGLTHDQLVGEWDRVASRTKRQVSLPRIDDAGSTVTPGTAQILNEILWKMTAVHYQDRVSDVNLVLRRLDSACKVIQNQVADTMRAAERRAQRERRKEIEIEKRARLARYLANGQ